MAAHPLVGTFLGVQYNVPGRVVIHVRFVSAAVDPARPLAFCVRTPDGHEYEEDFSDQNDFVRAVAAVDTARQAL